MQRMFFYNTDVRAIGGVSRADRLITHGIAVTGGDKDHFGRQLGQMAVGDLLLMYENRSGVIAVGEVAARWNEKTYTKNLYYLPNDPSGEYRIRVRWDHDLTQSPVSLEALRNYVGTQFTPRGATQAINKHRDAIQRCLEDHIGTGLPSPRASDVPFSPAKRKSITVSRIVRDSAMARKVKAMNHNRCQLCPTVLRMPDGGSYVEAHHIQPLGNAHKGPDDPANIICVCPNCHAKLDLGLSKLRPNDIRKRSNQHVIGLQFIDYHNEHVFRSRT